MSAGARAALYTTQGSTLMHCARYAELGGLRVVTMIDEEQVDIGFAGIRLKGLVDRLSQGEFEVIVADAGSGRVVTIAPMLSEATAHSDTLSMQQPNAGAVRVGSRLKSEFIV